MSDRFRCSVAAADEPLAGSAATDGAFLLVENPGPWGRKALAESRLPEHVRLGLADRAERAGVRVQLIRRHHRPAPMEGFRIFVVYADPAAPWAETTLLSHPEQLLDVDLEGLAAGHSLGLEPHPESLFLVCTNGRRDTCCAELGRPLVADLDAAYPEETWETTHIGGHRFAGAMLVLPAGLAYGRVTSDAGLHIADLTHEGELDLDHLRGRAAYDGEVQAAEIALLERLDLRSVDALTLVSAEVDGSETRVQFRHGDDVHTLSVTAVPGDAVRQSCADLTEKPTRSFLVS